MRSIVIIPIIFAVLLTCHDSEAFIQHVVRKIVQIGKEAGKGIVKVGKEIGKGVTKGVDILRKGCCGVHPSVCRMQGEFKNRQRDIKAKSAVIDRNWVIVKKVSANVKSGNQYNNLIYQHIRRITLVSESTIEVLDPSIIAKFNNVSNELRRQIQHKNQTILKYGINQIAAEYDKTKGESQAQILDATGIGGFQQTTGYLKMTADMFRMMKLEAVAKFMEGDVGNLLTKAKLAVSKLFGFHYLEKLAKGNEIASAVLKVVSFYSNYLSFHGGIFTLMNIMSKLTGWITDLATCNKQKRDLETNIRNLRRDHVKLNQNYKAVFVHKRNVESSWRSVRAQTISDAVFDQLVSIEDIARSSSSQSHKSRLALQAISNFRRHAKRATPANLINLQKKLAKALDDITYTAECYERKLAMYEAVYRGCKLGRGSFVDLYKRALLDFKPNDSGCRDSSGLPYTTRGDVKKFLKKKAEKEKFEMNCLLNSGLKKALACQEIHSGYTSAQVASKLQISLSSVTQLGKTCPSIDINSLEMKELCSMSKFIKLDKIYRVYHDVSRVEIKKAFGRCK